MIGAVERGQSRRARAQAITAAFRSEYPFEPLFLALSDGVELHYVDEGPRDAPVLLCLHGNPTWSFFFRSLVRGLADSHRVIAPDHVGCGLSDKPQDYPYRLETHIANVERLVEQLGLTEITLVVHDWGGAIGMGFARRHPEILRRLVVMNTAAFRSGAIPARISVCRLPFFGPLAVRGLGLFSRAALGMAIEHRERMRGPVRRGYLAPYAGWKDRVATLAFVRDIPLDASHPSWGELVRIEEALPLFRNRPMLIVWGECDWCFTPTFREEWQKRFPEAVVRIAPDAGHWVLEDAGDRALAWIADFLAGTEQRP